ncbi:peroxidase 7-like [Momordica charantia]|uniref:peroxidase n=1 Tax=Momordica charantia TaxID=3673 RepID=A0A6J1D7K8_MOMCH|nr:peroxidase 7-like [Momordica charantia]
MKFMEMPSFALFLLLLDLVVAAPTTGPPAASLLSHSYYQRTCPDAEGIIHRKVQAWINKDSTLAPALIRLHFHDCTVRMDLVFLDSTTPRMFDSAYFTNLQNKLGLLSTDQALVSDERTSSFVDLMANQPFLFDSQFSASMVKLGNVGVLTRKNEGEIRANCNFVNHRRK